MTAEAVEAGGVRKGGRITIIDSAILQLSLNARRCGGCLAAGSGDVV